MGFSKFFSGCLVIIIIVFFFAKTIQSQTELKISEKFGAVSCDEEMAILDRIENTLKSYPLATGYFFVYGGKSDTKRNEIDLRSARMKRYLIENRGIESSRVQMVNAGFRDKFTVEVWIVSVGEDVPKPKPTVSSKKIRFKKGKMPNWEEPGCYANPNTNKVKEKLEND